MRSLSTLAVALLAAIALQPTRAAASSCFVGPFIGEADVPVGCEVFAWYQTATAPPMPAITVMRDGVMVDLDETIVIEQRTLTVEYPQFDCGGGIASVTTQDASYELYRISLDGAIAGDQVMIGGWIAGRITATGMCAAPLEPAPSCGILPSDCTFDYEDEDGGGCNTSGSSAALAFGLLALALVLRARR